MNNNLKSILKRYEQKRTRKINDATQKKFQVYQKYPDLEKIDGEIASLSIKSIQSSLTSSDKKESDKIAAQIGKLKKEKEDLFDKYKLSNSVFLPKFDCDKCKDTGYIETSNGSVLCSCIKQELYNCAYNSSNIYDLENQNFSKFKLNVYSNKVDEDKYGVDVSPRDNIVTIKNLCDNFIENFDDPNEKNLLFCGYTGLGKTFLSSCIANEMIKRGKTVLYQTAPIMLDKIIDYKFGRSKDNIVDAIYDVDLLIIDDLGTETINNYKVTELFNIINSRILNQNRKVTRTIISTNLSLQDLYDTYEERIVSRIIGNYNACYFYGDDIRVKRS